MTRGDSKRRWEARNRDKRRAYMKRANEEAKKEGIQIMFAAANDLSTRQRLNDLRKILGIANYTDIVRYCVARVHDKESGGKNE